DRAGKPVAGASIRYWDAPRKAAPLKTNADGTFTLSGIPEGPSFVFVEAQGFRFTGRQIEAPASALELTLTRTTEKPESTMNAVAPGGTPAQRRELGLRLVKSIVDRAWQGGTNDNKIYALCHLAEFDPAKAMEHVQKNEPAGAASSNSIRANII